MIPRQIAPVVDQSRRGYQAALVLGPRQSGKTSLVRDVFRDLPYVNLESPIERAEVMTDPNGFLGRYPNGAILDEVQNTPELVSHLQVRIDEDGLMGRWALTGSQQFELTGTVPQSLAGRVAQFELLPFSHHELRSADQEPATLLQAVLTGGYPPLHDSRREILSAPAWLEDYVATFVNRDMRSFVELRQSRSFDLLLQRAAALTGQQVNRSTLAQQCGIDEKTVGDWLQALEMGFLAQIVRPYFRNFGKRLAKQPKLFFHDTGVACRLLGITTLNQLAVHPLRGALTETWFFNELTKTLKNRKRLDTVHFWRTSDGHEVDFVLERGHQLIPIEAKATGTPSSKAVDGITTMRKLEAREDGVEIAPGIVIYAGDELVERSGAMFVPWNRIDEAIEAVL